MLQLHALLPPGLQLVPGQPPLAPLAQQTWPFWPHATQLPFRQVCEELQVVPQLPQWVGAACSFVQALLPPQWPLAQDVEPLQSCCPVGQPQEPPEHEAPVSQGWPQAPQLSGSVWRFVHRLPQSISDDRQEVTQVPELHVYPAEQGWLQPPQLSGSVWVFVQRVPQRVSVDRQMVVQLPELQVFPAEQGWLQPPQLSGSVWVSAHRLPQRLSLERHVVAHTPEPLQSSPAGQGLLQPPQLSGSVLVFVQRLLHRLSLDRQVVAHTPEPLQNSPAGQGWLQPPQLSGSVWVFVQRPLHRLSLARQVVAHTPEPLQSLPAGQGWLQTPQFALSVWRFVQRAEAPEPQAFGTAAGQVQLLPEQLWPPGQAVPQPPQFCGSLVTSVHLLEQSFSPATQTTAQLLDTQLSPAGHALAQPPQLRASLVVSVHFAPPSGPQRLSPARHWVEQWPVPSQTWPVGQAFPQPPQLVGSLVVSVHLPPQAVSLAGQLMAHFASEHVSPGGQAVPQAPQLAGSVWRSWQATPPSAVRQVEFGAAQTQAPAAQVCSGEQTLLQAPQLRRSEDSCVQPPSHSVPPAAAQLACWLSAGTHSLWRHT